MSNQNSKRIFTVAEAARYSGYSRGMIEYWISEGYLKCEEPPSRGNGCHRFRRIRREELDAMLDRFYFKDDQKTENKVSADELILLPRENYRQGRRLDS